MKLAITVSSWLISLLLTMTELVTLVTLMLEGTNYH